MRHTTRYASSSEWAAILEASESDYALSQTYEFGEAIARAYPEYSYEARVFEFDDGLVMALPLIRIKSRLGFLRRYEAMPFSLNGSPVCAGGHMTGEHLSAALNALRADSIQINTGGSDCALSDGSMLAAQLEAIEHSTHVLDLGGGFDSVWKNGFTSKVRNQCRAAERKGVKVFAATGIEDFEAYYSIYAASTVRWGYDKPPYPLALFHSIAALAGRGVELLLARVEGQTVAGVLLMHGRRTTLYWSAAMLADYASYNANNALLRAAIEGCCRRGMKRFDFGSSGELHSVRKYKESFGARAVAYRNFASTAARYRLVSQARRTLAQVGI